MCSACDANLAGRQRFPPGSQADSTKGRVAAGACPNGGTAPRTALDPPSRSSADLRLQAADWSNSVRSIGWTRDSQPHGPLWNRFETPDRLFTNRRLTSHPHLNFFFVRVCVNCEFNAYLLSASARDYLLTVHGERDDT